jgi:hypothetical protein
VIVWVILVAVAFCAGVAVGVTATRRGVSIPGVSQPKLGGRPVTTRRAVVDLDKFVIQPVMRSLVQVADADPVRREQAKQLGARIEAAAVELAGALLRAGVLLDRANKCAHLWQVADDLPVLTSYPPKYQQRCKHCGKVRQRSLS